MSQPLVFAHPTPFVSHLFMQNQYPPTNGLYQPVKPKRNRKRKWNETDLQEEEQSMDLTKQGTVDHDSAYLNFIKPSTKRRRTNNMKHQQSAILKPELEHNIYCNQLNGNHTNTNNKNTNESENNRCESPYVHLVHPYLRNKSRSPQINQEETPEIVHLNGFKMNNKQNESVEDWKTSIQSQLNHARTQKSNVEELCQRVRNSHGLGRHVLMAKLRKELPNQTFMKICQIMQINPQQR
eukprot:56328_1